MRIRDKHRINCDRYQVWDRLTDFKYLGRVIPGGKKFSKSGRNRYNGSLRVKVGFFKGKLNATLTLERKDKPRAFRLRVYAKGNGIKINGDIDFRLKRIGECETELSYEGNLNCGSLPGFVKGEVHKKLKKAIRDLCKKIEKDCIPGEKRQRARDAEEPLADVSKAESQFEQEAAAIISKAQMQFEEELAVLITKAGSQLKVDLMELIKKIENERK